MTSHAPTQKPCTLDIIDLGHADYEKTLKLQYSLQNRRRQGKVQDTVLIAEHPPTITFGVREGINRLVADRNFLKEAGIELVHTNRGGGATAHNPGQVVCYPILDLTRRSMRVDDYISTLEDIGVCLLEKLCVSAKRREGFPGLWVGASDGEGTAHVKKIASIGIHLSGMVTAHGIAINIQNDLSIFDHIVPCGMDGVSLTSVREVTGLEQDMGEVRRLLEGCVRKYLALG